MGLDRDLARVLVHAGDKYVREADGTEFCSFELFPKYIPTDVPKLLEKALACYRGALDRDVLGKRETRALNEKIETLETRLMPEIYTPSPILSAAFDKAVSQAYVLEDIESGRLRLKPDAA